MRTLVQGASDDEGREGWHVYADSDEFVGRDLPLRELAGACEEEGQIYALLRMIDRVAADGTFPEIAPSP